MRIPARDGLSNRSRPTLAVAWAAAFIACAGHALPVAGEQEPRSAGRRHALVVAIADYAADTGWPDLSAWRDLEILRPALEGQGFSVHAIVDDAADRAGIERAFRRHLIEAATEGDLAYFHYSGHGHRLTDDDGDEIDGYDELLVPYDAPARPGEGYAGERHLRDDDLDRLLRELRRKLGERGEVVVSIDSCFSGTGTRGEAPVRGRPTPIGPPATRDGGSVESPPASDTGGGYLETGVGRAAERGLAPLVAFSAARHDELAWEAEDDNGNLVGSLSLALTGALADSEPGDSYRTLFERIRRRMADYGVSNTPQAEGRLDAGLFQGAPIVQEPHYRVGRLSRSGRRLQLEAGSVMGLAPGARIAIFPAGTVAWREATPTTSGVIASVTPLQSIVDIEPAVYEEDVAAAWAYVTAQSFGPVGIVVRLDGEAAALREPLERIIAAEGTRLIAFDGKPHAAVRRLEGGWVIEQVADGRRLWGPWRREGDPAVELVDHLKSYARTRFLRRLDLTSDAFGVDIAVEPCAVDCDDFGDCTCTPPGAARTEGGSLILPVGTGYRLTIANTGGDDAYVQVLELMPDGRWDLLWPPRNRTQVPIAAGSRHRTTTLWQVAPPYGDNVLKAFASGRPIDFQWLLGARAATRGSEANPLELLFDEAMTPATRGSRKRPTIPADSGVATAAVTFRIVE